MGETKSLLTVGLVILAIFAATSFAVVITTPGYAITAPGTYTLSGNLNCTGVSNCINISASNVVLDCQGHALNAGVLPPPALADAVPTGQSAIVVNPDNNEGGYSNIVITNCKIENFTGYGVYATVVDNLLVNDSYFAMDRYGVYLNDATESGITKNTFDSVSGSVIIYNSNGVSVKDNTINWTALVGIADAALGSSAYGIYASYVSDTMIEGNTVTNGPFDAIYVNAPAGARQLVPGGNSNVRIIDNTLNGNYGGIYAYSLFDSEIRGNTINGSTNDGIYLFDFENGTVASNVVYGSGYSNIVVLYATDSIFTSNTVYGASGAAPLAGAANVDFRASGGAGFEVASCARNNFTANTVYQNMVGFDIYDTDGPTTSNKFASNLVYDNWYDGFYLVGEADDNSFISNYVYGTAVPTLAKTSRGGQGYGFYLDFYGYNNLLKSNTVHDHYNTGIYYMNSDWLAKSAKLDGYTVYLDSNTLYNNHPDMELYNIPSDEMFTKNTFGESKVSFADSYNSVYANSVYYSDVSGATVPEGYVALNKYIYLGPGYTLQAAQLSSPIDLLFHYGGPEMSGIQENSLIIARYDGIEAATVPSNFWTPLESNVDTDAKTVETVTGFGTYGLFGIRGGSSGGNNGGLANLDMTKAIACPGDVLTVTVTSGGNSVQNAYVKVYDRGTSLMQGALTDSQGKATFTLPESAAYDIEAEKGGYNNAIGIIFEYTLCGGTQPVVPQQNQTNQTPTNPTGGSGLECSNSSNCFEYQYCNQDSRCVNITQGNCGYIADHAWVNYACCADTDCASNQVCTPGTHICTQVPVQNQTPTAPGVTQQDAQAAISDAQGAIGNAGSQGKDTSDASKKLQDAQAAYDAGNYDLAKTLAEQAKTLALNAAAAPANTTGQGTGTTGTPAGTPQGGMNWMLLILLLLVIVVVGGLAYYFFLKPKK